MSEFDYQWKNIPCKPTDASVIQRVTKLPLAWFKNKTILDAGAGSGRFSKIFSELNANVVACDISFEGIHKCQTSNRIVMDIMHPALNTTFDMIWSYGVVHHIQQYEICLAQLSQLVKPGGYLTLMVYRRPITAKMFALYLCYGLLRQITKYWSSEAKLKLCGKLSIKFADVHGWFDAINPCFNKLFTLKECTNILHKNGLTPITYGGPKMHIEVMFKK